MRSPPARQRRSGPCEPQRLSPRSARSSVAGCNKDSGDLNRGAAAVQLAVRHLPHPRSCRDGNGVQGPNLDDAFAAARARGHGRRHDRGRRQGAGRRPAAAQPNNPSGVDAAPNSPAARTSTTSRHTSAASRAPDIDVLPRQTARAATSSPPAAPATPSPPRARHGTTGPNLDQTLAGKTAAFIKRVDHRPQQGDRQGLLGPGIMPQNVRPRRSSPPT